ncbi:MAG: hypothetical protein J3Q66DRAFT_386469 [Benniella sp.]|nr:MAG: hypothetical protein J3Q66DRAFT_386469 [Benniella sp.]
MVFIKHNVFDRLQIYEEDPSSFTLEGDPPEVYWQGHAWGVCENLAKGVKGSKILPGDITRIDSSYRRNAKEQVVDTVPQQSRKRMGVSADLFWRDVISPQKNWMVAASAKEWYEHGRNTATKDPSFYHELVKTLHATDGPVLGRERGKYHKTPNLLLVRIPLNLSIRRATIASIERYNKALKERNDERT